MHALVTAGEMWLTVGDHTRRLVAGDEFRLARDEVHAERYGSDGATYLAARKHRPDDAGQRMPPSCGV